MRAEPPLLSRQDLRPGQRWVYSAGFNVGPDLRPAGRIDCEVPDLRRLCDAGARVALLSHQGSHRDGTALGLGHVASHLARALGRPVGYHPANATDDAVARADELRDGEIVLFGNTREHAGEERGDPALARRFARLGAAVAVGGFAKAHRAHASNAAILDFLPGCAADNLVTEARALDPWAGRDPGRYSVAVLGGVKPEKTLVGLTGLDRAYDLLIPGGVVLNTLLRALGHPIGRSALGPEPERCADAARSVLADGRAELHVPDRVIVRRGDGRPATVDVDGVPDDAAVVDFELAPWAHERLARLRALGGRALVAGTPSRYTDGFTTAVTPLLAAFADPGVDALLLGGDTVAELPWAGPSSTGGGSALHYLADGTCAVFDALRRTRTIERTPTP
ncbi:phosphoglycerate kinase [Amycolatopsis sp. PS_44_ISF1]|uniref:phosphoglycerate kinase n=1 Tax=Amycolatopsis sp. PS_44_ISF1 TaxID=2974917 RepID=UPI0028DE51B5|nr:phosphoglycerate kinase [Amycolatopsis sp. PS_44_ISF1]MDT8910061.1 phosphoglycerate kinase [Amycolatopsis sp. PS_44_ISF1]